MGLKILNYPLLSVSQFRNLAIYLDKKNTKMVTKYVYSLNRM